MADLVFNIKSASTKAIVPVTTEEGVPRGGGGGAGGGGGGLLLRMQLASAPD